MSETTKTYRVRLEEQMMSGWTAELVDFASNPPKPVPGTKKFVETSQIAAMFTNTFGLNTGILEKPVGLSAVAMSPAKGAYLYVEPAKVRAINSFDGGRPKVYSMWVPASAWVIKCDHERSDKWEAKIALVVPDDTGLITPRSKVGQYPMSNTYGDFRICWGSVRPPQVKMPAQIRRIIDLFFGSEFNGHVGVMDGTSFFNFVKKFSTKEVVKDLDDEERWKMMMKSIPGGILRGSTLSSFWRGACGDLSTEEENDEEDFIQ